MNDEDLKNKFNLTKKEIVIFHLLKKGSSITSIASQLNRSYHTILNHKKNIFKKLHIHKISSLILLK